MSAWTPTQKDRTNWCRKHGDVGVTTTPEPCRECAELLTASPLCEHGDFGEACAAQGKLRMLVFAGDRISFHAHDPDVDLVGFREFVRCENLGVLCDEHTEIVVNQYQRAMDAASDGSTI